MFGPWIRKETVRELEEAAERLLDILEAESVPTPDGTRSFP